MRFSRHRTLARIPWILNSGTGGTMYIFLLQVRGTIYTKLKNGELAPQLGNTHPLLVRALSKRHVILVER